MINSATRAIVVARAGNRCEYCLLPQDAYDATFHIDHIIARQHIVIDDAENLSLACPGCNYRKGSNLAGLDPQTQAIVALFNPRKENWTVHFRWAGAQIVGLTPQGRATIVVLDLNSEERVRLRQTLIAEGAFPPA